MTGRGLENLTGPPLKAAKRFRGGHEGDALIRSQEGQGQLPQPVRTDSLASQAFTIIKDAIFTGQFQPGQLLRELHLARMLNVSQATIREALVQLEQVGLVVREQNRHTM